MLQLNNNFRRLFTSSARVSLPVFTASPYWPHRDSGTTGPCITGSSLHKLDGKCVVNQNVKPSYISVSSKWPQSVYIREEFINQY